jgi:septal ring factor EnvC (AmiA/AmiB activator)
MAIATFQELQTYLEFLESQSSSVSKQLQALDRQLGKPDGAFPSDAIRLNPERAELKARSSKIFQEIRKVNTILVKHYKKELAQTRKYK